MSVTQETKLITLIHDLARQINDASSMLEAEHGLSVTYDRPDSSAAHEILQVRIMRVPLPELTHGLHHKVPSHETHPESAP